MVLFHVIRSMRPRQWTKNLVVFAALVFAMRLEEPHLLLRTIAAFGVFCLMSGCVYLLNDLKDREKDRLHPRKALRPIAAGQLSGTVVVSTMVALLAGGLVGAYLLGPYFFATTVAFLALNTLYSLWLRSLILLDVMAISASFVLRAIAGAEVLKDSGEAVEISPWLLMCTFFLSLFLALGKRRHELRAVGADHRSVLGEYSVDFVDRLTAIAVGVTLLSYSLYTIWPDTVERFGTDRLIFTIPIVFYGLSRYLYLVLNRDKGGDPSEMLVTDRSILLTVLLWSISVFFIVYRG